MTLSLDRVAPQAVAEEQAVLSAMLLDGRAVDAAREIVSIDDFQDTPHRCLFCAIAMLHDNNRDVDQLSIADELRRSEQLDLVGGVPYIARIAGEVASWAGVKSHARIVHEKAQLRRIIELTNTICDRAFTGSEDSTDLLQYTDKYLLELQNGTAEGGLVAYEQVLSDTLERIELHRTKGGQIGLSSGFRSLDKLTGGFQSGEYILLAGRPKMGKSALSLLWADHAAKIGKHVAMFSLEMRSTSLAERHLSMQSNVPAMFMRTGQLTAEYSEHLAKSATTLSRLPLYIDDRAGLSVLDIRTACRKIKRERGLDMIIVDYIQLMTPATRAGNREQEVSQMSRGLKNLARDMDCPLIALSQLSRKCEERNDKRPVPSDLRDSGSLEQDCDMLMFVFRPEVYDQESMAVTANGQTEMIPATGMAEIIIALQRNGPSGSVYAQWDAACTRFTEKVFDFSHSVPSDEFTHHDNE